RKKNQLVVRRAVGIIAGLALVEVHLQFAREQIRRKLADEQHDHAGVRDLDAELLRRKFKTVNVRRDQVHQQQRADKITAGQQQRDFFAEEMRADHQPLLEIMRLRAVKPFIRLRDGADEYDDNRERQQHDREFQRREKLDNFFHGRREDMVANSKIILR